MSEQRTFDAPAHMRKIRTRQGMQDYLDVKWRVMWLRSDHPDANIVTEQIEGDAEHARFKCTISYATGITHGSEGPAHVVVATGHGSETQQDFPDFYEKAETKAIGRACAVMGYGTDAANDFDEGEPLDGLPAAKAERAARHEDIRRQADEQHVHNGNAPALTRLPVNRSEVPAEQRAAPQSTSTPLPRPGTSTEGQATGVRALREAAKHDLEMGTPHARAPQPLPMQQTPGNSPAAAPTESNVHQHAQLRSLAEHGFDLQTALARAGAPTVEALSREQAKDIIIEARQAVRGNTDVHR